MDARAWMVRLTLGVGLAGGFAAQAPAQTPTPTPSVTPPTGSPTPTATLAPSGAPKILLAFDASGSMLTDDGKGTPKIDAAKEGAVALLSTLPDSTEVGLRLFGGTRPSRPIGPACQDSSLVLPLGRVDRGEAEASIRSFKARGRTPIAYALEQAAKDLGDSGSRTIVLVSDGKDTCRPPAPCDVAREISKGGVELRIQAIGFRVDEEARQELECIAAAGGGVYRDATDAASLRQELRVLSTRALREYVARGAATKGGPSARAATVLKPGRYVDKILPDSEHWFAIELARGETLKASVSFIAPERGIEDYGTDSSLDIVTPDFDIPSYQNSSASGTPFDRRGYVSALGTVSRPIGVGDQAEEGQPFSEPGRYYLKVAFQDSSEKALYNLTGGKPYDAELAVEVLGRTGKAPAKEPASPTMTSLGVLPANNEPPSTAILTLVGGGLAAAGFAGAAVFTFRRRRP